MGLKQAPYNYTHWELPGDTGPKPCERVAAWHATFNAALSRLVDRGFEEGMKLAEETADRAHGPIAKYHVRVFEGGSSSWRLNPPDYLYPVEEP